MIFFNKRNDFRAYSKHMKEIDKELNLKQPVFRMTAEYISILEDQINELSKSIYALEKGDVDGD